ncbi:MAG: hypothetical protein RLZZ630_1764 [Bacteroidota bacterium]|jgi:ATP-dependent DNA helicase RecQ
MSLIHQLLTQYWGHTRFRPLQEEIIRSVLDGKDTLALLPTGGGKSICFQVPALAQPGLCLVVSPLIALMRDQEEQLKRKGIRAVALVSGMSKAEIERSIENCFHGDFKFLYVSPERLASTRFREALGQMKLNMIAIDEAHCISQWGYDFRPPYMRIAEVRAQFPGIPVLALTASATPEVQKDICNKLNMHDPQVFARSFARPNLSYIVRHTDDKSNHLHKVLQSVPGTSIVYVRNRRRTQELAIELQRLGIRAGYYHAGLDHAARQERQVAWMEGKLRVIVATNAFGMGIDKPDVRSVIHMDLPDNPESYYQEAGRAGRDEKLCYGVILYNDGDLFELERKVEQSFPERALIRRVYSALSNYLQVPIGFGQGQSFAFEVTAFSQRYNLEPVPALHALQILELTGYISIQEAIYLPARVRITVNPMNLYRFQVEQPAYDHLIKVLLRSYSGLFDDYVRFSEKDLAKRAETDTETLRKQLIYLRQIELIDYHPATDEPSLTFLENRVSETDLRIPSTILEERKERAIHRIQAMIRFLNDRHQCRSVLLLSYFGEKDLKRCGICDVCRERNRLEMNDLEVEEIINRIRTIVGQQPLSVREILDQSPGIPTDKLQAVLRWMLDTGELNTDAIGRIILLASE